MLYFVLCFSLISFLAIRSMLVRIWNMIWEGRISQLIHKGFIEFNLFHLKRSYLLSILCKSRSFDIHSLQILNLKSYAEGTVTWLHKVERGSQVLHIQCSKGPFSASRYTLSFTDIWNLVLLSFQSASNKHVFLFYYIEFSFLCSDIFFNIVHHHFPLLRILLTWISVLFVSIHMCIIIIIIVI